MDLGVRARLIPGLPRLLDSMGHKSARDLNRAGLDIDELTNSEKVISTDRYWRYLELASRSTGDAHISFRYTNHVSPEDWGGTFSRLVLNVPDLYSALFNTSMYMHYFHNAITANVRVGGGNAYLSLTMPRINGYEEAMRMDIESSVASWINVCRYFLGPAWQPTEVQFQHSRPSNIAIFEEAWRCSIRYNSPFNGFVFPAVLLKRGAKDHEPEISDKARIDILIQKIKDMSRPGFEEQILRHLLSQLRDGSATLSTLSHKMQTSSRSLQRRLASNNQTFKSFQNESRRLLAHDLLAYSQHPVAEISHRLGYQNPGHFTRAFKRMTGRAPSTYRAEERPAFLVGTGNLATR